MVGVGLSTKDDNLRNDRWQIIIRKDVRVRLFITALQDKEISTSDNNDYYTEDNCCYCYFLLNVITFILLQHITVCCMIIIVLG